MICSNMYVLAASDTRSSGILVLSGPSPPTSSVQLCVRCRRTAHVKTPNIVRAECARLQSVHVFLCMLDPQVMFRFHKLQMRNPEASVSQRHTRGENWTETDRCAVVRCVHVCIKTSRPESNVYLLLWKHALQLKQIESFLALSFATAKCSTRRHLKRMKCVVRWAAPPLRVRVRWFLAFRFLSPRRSRFVFLLSILATSFPERETVP